LKRKAQIVLGRCPTLRQVSPRIDLKSAATSGSSIFEQLAALFTTTERPEF
jgi:hypothetical protein